MMLAMVPALKHHGAADDRRTWQLSEVVAQHIIAKGLPQPRV